MLTITKPEPNRLDVELAGKLDAEAMAKGLDELITLSRDINRGVMLYRVISVEFPDLGALSVQMTRLPKLFGLLGRFDRCAVLSDAAWVRTAAEVEGAFFPGIEIKAFALNQGSAAEAWLKTGMA
ncbi:STAS/SEC14 domain-containing protein [Marivita sp. GX14005]|uniref:STAS/SEC14 domain-containing protein n=1 Tax=Marivita sp. GX14005 TaxID=2942276 RepID=UPI00201981F7|nr:STAS/SEC14 domain-containing protein [Marivita sp. GX14005]MCL3880856.1 STAS/SEC14 domain-containing protein [Marivita sp. GX14005]